jgi:nucleoside 2-deoxyribosyltransferase
MKSLYIASSLLNKERVQSIRDKLLSRGISISYDWTAHGFVDDLNELPNIAEKELNGVREASCILMILPARNGSHFEFGYAIALNKPVIILNDQDDYVPTSFHFLDSEEYNVYIKKDEDGAIDFVENVLTNLNLGLGISPK